MSVDRYKQIVGWAAVLIGIAAETVAIWLLDRLPLWGQMLVYAPGVIAFVLGMVVLGRDLARKRRRKRPAAED